MTYLTMNETQKSRWRHEVFTALRHSWIMLVSNDEFNGTLQQYIGYKIKDFEAQQKYEACAGLKDILNEYAAEMDQ